MDGKLIEYQDGMNYGRGYNRLTGESMPSRAVVGDTARVKNADGQRTTTSLRITSDVQTLHESLGIEVDAGGSYMGFSASAKLEYAKQCDFSSFSTYIIIHVLVANAFEDITEPKFHPDAEELLSTNSTVRFRERFGDCFVSGLGTGGDFYAIYQLTGTYEAKKQALALDVEASWQGILASADLHVNLRQARDSTTEHVETKIFVYREGAIRTADLTSEDIIETARQFPVEVGTGEAFVYAAMLQDYKTLRSPNDAFDYYQIQAQQEALAELAKKRFEFLALRDDIAFILANSDDFMNADRTSVDHAVLSADFDRITAEINDMQNKMSAYSRDASKADLPSYDSGKYELPILKPKSGGIPVTSLVGLRVVAIDHALEDKLRKYEDYEAVVLAEAEPGSPGCLADKTQYDFLLSGVKFEFAPPMESPGGPHFHYLQWIVAQDPLSGDAGTDTTIILTWKNGMRYPGAA